MIFYIDPYRSLGPDITKNHQLGAEGLEHHPNSNICFFFAFFAKLDLDGHHVQPSSLHRIRLNGRPPKCREQKCGIHWGKIHSEHGCLSTYSPTKTPVWVGVGDLKHFTQLYFPGSSSPSRVHHMNHGHPTHLRIYFKLPGCYHVFPFVEYYLDKFQPNIKIKTWFNHIRFFFEATCLRNRISRSKWWLICLLINN